MKLCEASIFEKRRVFPANDAGIATLLRYHSFMESNALLPPVLLYDGVCGLCDGLVQWVIRRDPEGRIRFASLQSDRGRSLAQGAGIAVPEIESRQTVFFLHEGRVYRKSEAIRGLLRILPYPSHALLILFFMPRAFNDFWYDRVARHRYRIFGKLDSCRIPAAGQKDRFIE
jgi:predicted DCC family thiol-disulfide oxidoreductase YuxK